MTRDRLDLLLEAYFRPAPAPAGLAARVLAAARVVERVGLPFKGRLAIRASARGIVGIAHRVTSRKGTKQDVEEPAVLQDMEA